MIRIEELLRNFDVAGRVVEIESEGNGYINDTFVVILDAGGVEDRVVLQRINQAVFTRPQDVMGNLRQITEHCHRKINRDAGRYAEQGRHWQLTHIIPTRDGRDFFEDERGNVWRCLTYIGGARAYATVQSDRHAEECGLAVGHFLSLVSDMDPARLRQTIPGFHVTSEYLRQFDAAPKDGLDPALARFVDERREAATLLERAEANGELTRRVIHGDPRINNILIGDADGQAMAMIDLDTSCGGLVQMDVGDAVRSICNPAGEDYRELADVRFKTDVFGAFMRGFMREARGFLMPEDVEYLYPAIRLLPFELGLRFLTDHLNGDRYFKVPQRGQNLHRAIGQFRLCELIEKSEAEIRKTIERNDEV